MIAEDRRVFLSVCFPAETISAAWWGHWYCDVTKVKPVSLIINQSVAQPGWKPTKSSKVESVTYCVTPCFVFPTCVLYNTTINVSFCCCGTVLHFTQTCFYYFTNALWYKWSGQNKQRLFKTASKNDCINCYTTQTLLYFVLFSQTHQARFYCFVSLFCLVTDICQCIVLHLHFH